MSDRSTNEVAGEQVANVTRGPLRLLWPVIACVAFWLVYVGLGQLSIFNFYRFLWRLGGLLLFMLVFLVWWLTRHRYSWRERIGVIVAMLLTATVCILLLDPTVLPPAVLMISLPIMFTLWTIVLALPWEQYPAVRLAGMLLVPILCFAPLTLFRQDGLRGDGQADLHWRFSRTAEQQFLTRKKEERAVPAVPEDGTVPLVASESDWPEFRGVHRDATIHGVHIETDWKMHPPKLLWRRPVGPAWSSIIVVANRVYTQEQRGEVEAVSCFDAATGEEVWVHEEPGRFFESLGGTGPRATPTFANGVIFALGATGRLQALDAVTGQLRWSANIFKDSGGSVPIWGCSGSPLIIDDHVIVFAGNEDKDSPARKQLLAYNAADGKIQWMASAGESSYSSPQWIRRGESKEVVFLGNRELAAFDPDTGTKLWQYTSNDQLGRPTLQPRFVDENQVLVSFSPDPGISLVKLSGSRDNTECELQWSSRGLKPDFNDFVHHEGAVYGFDGVIFGCIDLATGEKNWKGGRYGAGQVLLLADQPVLLVLTEGGELVLVATDPQRHRELARIPGVAGKTWNHPAIVRDRLFVRSSEEMACFVLATTPPDAASDK